MTDKEKIQEYAKTHSQQETVAYFNRGEGSTQISMGLSLYVKTLAEYWTEAQEEETPEETPEEAPEEAPETPPAETKEANIITLAMYADNGKAIWEYKGKSEDGSPVECKGEIKNKNFAIQLAKRTAARCNQFKSHLEFDHGRSVEGNPMDMASGWGDLVLSQEALEAVEAELRKAKFQSQADGFYTSWR